MKGSSIFYGWIVAIAAFFIVVVMYGSYISFGVFLRPLIEEFDSSRAVTSGIFSTYMVLHGASGIAMGWLSDRYGPRRVVAAGAFLSGLGYALGAQSTTIWQLYVFCGLIVGVGMGAYYPPLVSTVSRWFVKRRGLAVGMVVAGLGVGQMVMPPVAAHLVEQFGWRTSFIIIGVIVWAIPTAASLFLRRSPRDMGLLPYGETIGIEGVDRGQELTIEKQSWSALEVVRNRMFWLMMACLLPLVICHFILSGHIVAHAIDIGVAAVAAAGILTSIGAGSAIGRITMGSISDRIGRGIAFTIGLSLMAATMFWLLRAGNLWALYIFALPYGLGYGGAAAMVPLLLGDFFGIESLGAIVGIMSFIQASTGAIGPLAAGYVFDVTGSYLSAFLIAGLLVVVAVLLSLTLKPPTRERQ